ncbi:MAG: sugar transferase [Chitinispirillaceae bacterium]|jgi:lipopolysaccharide/colanic/teichoic acid biosynthesis glycosyltransferase
MKFYETYTYPHHGFSLQETHGVSIRNSGVIVPLQIPFWKRVLDIAISLTCIAFIFPLVFLVVALFIKMVSRRGPVLFRQKRVGVGGKPFTLLKFRTMHSGDNATMHDAHIKILMDSNAPMVKLEDYPRIIPLGKVLRASGIDELPQLFNVLCGDMSIVGPRPCIPYEQAKYLPWHHQRLDVPPGLTGLWQVSGKNRLTFQQMMRLDIAYVRNISLWMDIKIIVKTPLAILQQVGDVVSKKIIGMRSDALISRTFSVTTDAVQGGRYVSVASRRITTQKISL